MRYTLPLPPSINSYWKRKRNGGVYKSQEARDWEEAAGYKILDMKKFGDKKVTITAEFYFKDHRSDLNNRLKILEDLLEQQGIVDNDKQIWESHTYKFIDKEMSRCEIEVSEYLER